MAAPGENLRINSDRLWDSIMEMAKIGRFRVRSLSEICNVGGDLDLRGFRKRGRILLTKGEKIVEPSPIRFYGIRC